MKLTNKGHCYLGSYIGTEDEKHEFVQTKVDEWIKDVTGLAEIADLRNHS